MEILIWGDNMKRQISIFIFLVILVLVLAWWYLTSSDDTQPEEHGVLTEHVTEEEQAVPISQTYVSYQFYIKDDGGRLAVYEVNTQKIYAQTGIETSSLSEEMQEKLSTGIYFQNEEELYNFLESYSS